MQLLPVVQRELLVAARQRMTYLSRTLSAGILLPLFALLHNLHAGGPVFGGAHILGILSTIVFIECMLAGIRYTSDCLSEERREGTLGLLFLTDLTGLDIVLGKVLARGLRAFFNLLAVFPILALTVLMGGVTGGQIVAICITLALCVFFSLAAGAFISSIGYRERNVLVGTLAFLLGITFFPMGLNLIATRIFGFYGFVDTVLLLSPYYAFNEAGRGFTPNLKPSLWILLLASATSLAYAAWRIRRTFGETEPVRQAPVTPVRRRSIRIIGRRNPLSWLSQRGRIKRRWIAGFSLFICAFGFFASTAIAQQWNWAIPIVFLGSYALHAIYKFLLTAETCRQLNEDRRSGALEILLVTPASASRIARTQLAATWRAWFPAMLALGFMNYLWMSQGILQRDRVINVLLPVSLILLLADTIVLPCRSVIRALHGERYTVTVFKTFLRTNGPPLALIAFMLGMSIGTNAESTVVNCFIWWTILCLAFGAVLVVDFRAQLKNFRTLAAGEEIPPPWRRRVSFLRGPRSLPLPVSASQSS